LRPFSDYEVEAFELVVALAKAFEVDGERTFSE
jgi:hypothetical protein